MNDRGGNTPASGLFGPRTPYGWWAIGAHGGLVLGALPEALPTASLFVDARLDPTVDWNPSFRLSAKRAIYPGASDRPEVSWTSGRADVCPNDIPLYGREFGLWLCGTFETALISGTGVAASPDVYFAGGAVGRVQWILADVLLMEIESGLSLPFTDGTYEDGSLAATLFTSAGIGARFP